MASDMTYPYHPASLEESIAYELYQHLADKGWRTVRRQPFEIDIATIVLSCTVINVWHFDNHADKTTPVYAAVASPKYGGTGIVVHKHVSNDGPITGYHVHGIAEYADPDMFDRVSQMMKDCLQQYVNDLTRIRSVRWQ